MNLEMLRRGATEIKTTFGRYPRSLQQRYFTDLESISQEVPWYFENATRILAAQNPSLYSAIQNSGYHSDGQSLSIEPLASGWFGMAFRVAGNWVMKISHPQPPVEGFGNTPTQKGAIKAREHLQTMQNAADDAHLPFLVERGQDVVYVPGNDGYGDAIVTLQPHYDLLSARDIRSGEVPQNQLSRLDGELLRVIQFVHLIREKGLLPDFFSKKNLSIARFPTDDTDNPEYHFVLVDVGPVDGATAGPIAQLGMNTWIVGRLLQWGWRMGSIPRELLPRSDIPDRATRFAS